MHPKLNLPAYPFKIKSAVQRTQIFDTIRKKYIALTPEEWVRQHFVQYLINEKKVPASLIGIEISLKYNSLKKRSDIVIYSNTGQPLLIVECKAPEIEISQDTFDQVAVYNSSLKVKYLVVTNGMMHYCCIMDYSNNSYCFIEEIPLHRDL